MTFRNPAAERQRPQGADQIESRSKRGCAAVGRQDI